MVREFVSVACTELFSKEQNFFLFSFVSQGKNNQRAENSLAELQLRPECYRSLWSVVLLVGWLVGRQRPCHGVCHRVWGSSINQGFYAGNINLV